MPTSPTPIDAAPAVPTSTDPESTFDAMFEAFMAWMKNNAQPGMNGAASVTYANAVEATTAAALASAQAAAALATINATMWVSGTSYAYGVAAWSPANGRTYRRKLPGGISTTDPSEDPAGWWDVASFALVTTVPVTTASTLALGVCSRLKTDGINYALPLSPQPSEWVAFRNQSGGSSINLDPGPTNKVEGETGLHRIDHPAGLGRLVWTGATDGWVYTP